MTTEVGTDKIADIVREMLTERFHDEFVFSPIIVEPRIDHDGDEYLHTYIGRRPETAGSYMDRRPVGSPMAVCGKTRISRHSDPVVRRKIRVGRIFRE